MQLRSHSFQHGQRIPVEFAFGKPAQPVELSDNRTPHLTWTEVPAGTRSFVLTCIDPDVPSVGDDVNRPDRIVPASLSRVDFVHWLIANIPAACHELAAGQCGDGIVAGGKRQPAGPAGSVQGLNDYTAWFKDDAEMGGDYLGYDGPCPPWNDERLHHYHFRLYALDVAILPLPAGFTRRALDAALAGHVLAEAELVGIYTLNPAML